MDDLDKKYRIDDHRESYQNMFSDNWCERVSTISDDSQILRQFVFDLIADWRGAHYTASFPAMLPDMQINLAKGLIGDPVTDSTILRIADTVLIKLAQDISEVTEDSLLRQKLYGNIVNTASDFKTAQNKVPFPLTIDQLWQAHLSNEVFQLTVCNALRICYVSIYNTYDNFIGQCISIAHSKEIRTSDGKDFRKLFLTAIGENALDKCWAGEEIDMARKIRHKLSHAGGRVDSNFKYKDKCLIEDNVIQILPDEIKQLFSVLKEAVSVLVDIAKDKPEFQ
jgi:hypothetical protein